MSIVNDSRSRLTSSQNKKQMLKPGRYRHFKGNEYQVIEVARHSETLEEFVVYRALYENKDGEPGGLWIRPLKMFTEEVERDGRRQPRFALIEANPLR